MNRTKPAEIRTLVAMTALALGSFACGGARSRAVEPEFEFDAAECAATGKCGGTAEEDDDLGDLEVIVPRPLPTIARNR